MFTILLTNYAVETIEDKPFQLILYVRARSVNPVIAKYHVILKMIPVFSSACSVNSVIENVAAT